MLSPTDCTCSQLAYVIVYYIFQPSGAIMRETCRDSNPDRQTLSLVAILTALFCTDNCRHGRLHSYVVCEHRMVPATGFENVFLQKSGKVLSMNSRYRKMLRLCL